MTPGMRAERVLSVLAMANTVNIMRHMHLNGWFTITELANDLDMDPVTLENQLEVMSDAGLLLSDRNSESTAYRLNRDLPKVDLKKVVAGRSEFLEVAKFYLGTINTLVVKASKFDEELGPVLRHELERVNGWKDPKAKAVLGSFDPRNIPGSTMGNLERMVQGGVLTEEDIGVLKKVMLSYLTSIILKIESRTDSTVSKLLFRLASGPCIEEARELVEKRDLRDEIPGDYLRQI